MAKIEMAQMVRSAAKTKPRDVSSDNAKTSTDFAQMLKGKDQAVQDDGNNPKTENKDDGQNAQDMDVKDSQKQEDTSQVTQKDTEVQVPVEIMLQLQAALNQLMEKQMPDTETMGTQMAEIQVKTEPAEAILSEVTAQMQEQTADAVQEQAADAVQEQTAVAGGLTTDEAMFFTTAKQAEVQTLPVRKEAADSENNANTVPDVTAVVGNEDQLVVTAPEQSVHKQAAGQDETQNKDSQEHDAKPAEEPVYAENLSSAAGRVQFNETSVRDTAGTVTVKTTPETFPADVGKAIAAKLPGNNSTLTIELEPAALGKMTIKVVYEAGRAAVSIMSANPKTLELLSQSAGDIAQILEEKTGQQTVVYTPDPQQDLDGRQERQENGGQRHDRDEERKQNQPDTFAQQLRLGLV